LNAEPLVYAAPRVCRQRRNATSPSGAAINATAPPPAASGMSLPPAMPPPVLAGPDGTGELDTTTGTTCVGDALAVVYTGVGVVCTGVGVVYTGVGVVYTGVGVVYTGVGVGGTTHCQPGGDDVWHWQGGVGVGVGLQHFFWDEYCSPGGQVWYPFPPPVPPLLDNVAAWAAAPVPMIATVLIARQPESTRMRIVLPLLR